MGTVKWPCGDGPVEMAGIEPATATLAGRARYLSCHPRGQASANLPRLALCVVRTLWTCQLSSLYERLCGTVNSASGKRKPPRGNFLGAAAGKCLFALTRQPLPRSGQPEAATPGSCIHVSEPLRRLACGHISRVGRPPRRGNRIFLARSTPGGSGPGWVDVPLVRLEPDRCAIDPLGTGDGRARKGPDGVAAAFVLWGRTSAWRRGGGVTSGDLWMSCAEASG